MSDPRQGQIWIQTSRLTGQSRTIVLVDSDLVISERSTLIAAPIREAREVPSRYQLLTVETGTGTEVAALYDLASIPKNSLTTYISELPADALERLKVGLRARFDL